MRRQSEATRTMVKKRFLLLILLCFFFSLPSSSKEWSLLEPLLLLCIIIALLLLFSEEKEDILFTRDTLFFCDESVCVLRIAIRARARGNADWINEGYNRERSLKKYSRGGKKTRRKRLTS